MEKSFITSGPDCIDAQAYINLHVVHMSKSTNIQVLTLWLYPD